MTTVPTQDASHAHQKQQSYINLQRARELATNASNYSTNDTRQALTTACLERCSNWHPPHPWQLDAAEAFYLGLDCTIIVGAGFGKNLPFIMPSMISSDKILVVISLELDQARQSHNMGLTAVDVNHRTYTNQLHQELEQRQYQIIFASPEVAISNRWFNALLCSSDYQKRLLGVVIDEAHCMVQWDHAYWKLNQLRSFIPMNIPLYVTSAMMSPDILAQVRRLLRIDPSRSFHINLGNDRKNIYQEIRLVRNRRDFTCLDFLFEGATCADELERALIFADRAIDAQKGWQHSYKLLPPHLREYVGFLHPYRSEGSTARELELFRVGERRILWVTEVDGMGLDIPDITFVGQLGAPQSLTVWMQRAGRAGRAGTIQARAVLFIESSALQEIRSRNVADADSDADSDTEEEEEEEVKIYREELEPSLREYVETQGCRRDIVDKLYDNPPGRLGLDAMCCDNCTTAKNTQPPSLSQSQHLKDAVKPETTQDALPAGRRSHQHLQDVRDALLSWRRRIAHRDFPYACFTSAVILPDPVLTAIASKRSLSTLEDLQTMRPTRRWAFADRYGEEVLALVRKLDEEDVARREAKEAASLEAQHLEKMDGSRLGSLQRDSE